MAGTAKAASAAREKKKLVTVMIPKRGKSDKRRFVSVNGRKWSIKTNTPVRVPREVAEVVIQSVRQRDACEAWLERLAEENDDQ